MFRRTSPFRAWMELWTHTMAIHNVIRACCSAFGEYSRSWRKGRDEKVALKRNNKAFFCACFSNKGPVCARVSLKTAKKGPFWACFSLKTPFFVKGKKKLSAERPLKNRVFKNGKNRFLEKRDREKSHTLCGRFLKAFLKTLGACCPQKIAKKSSSVNATEGF